MARPQVLEQTVEISGLFYYGLFIPRVSVARDRIIPFAELVDSGWAKTSREIYFKGQVLIGNLLF